MKFSFWFRMDPAETILEDTVGGRMLSYLNPLTHNGNVFMSRRRVAELEQQCPVPISHPSECEKTQGRKVPVKDLEQPSASGAADWAFSVCGS